MTQFINTTINSHTKIKIKPVDVESSIYFDFNKENNKQGSELTFGDHVRILKFKNIFAKSYFPNWSEKVFVI